jgi:hypothetical protein
MSAGKSDDHKLVPHNYLVDLKPPPITLDQAYSTPKKFKTDFSYLKGEESHLVRRRLILKDHPSIAKLLVDDKPYTIIIALVIIAFCLLNCYWAKVIDA